MEAIRKKGTLFVVSTPLGNLRDITLRALDTLREVSFVACEDTRVTRRLLAAHGISNTLVSYREQNREASGRKIIAALGEGRDGALVSDAGTPGISDPGEHLVRCCIEEGISVVPVPGPSSIVTALTVSGLATDRFVFLGFLPRRGKKRETALAELAAGTATAVIFESPQRTLQTLTDLKDRVGDREIAVCRELTKMHEEIVRGPVSAVIDRIGQREGLRGEVVIVLAGREERREAVESHDLRSEAVRAVALYPDAGVKELAGVVAERLRIPASVAYREIVGLKKEKPRR